MLIRLLLLSLLLPALARADLKWTATTVFTAGAPSGESATAQFTFTNTGTYPIKITGTRTSCGCTAAGADEKAIAPGETGKIDVSFKTLNRRGLYEEPIDIETDDPNNLKTTVYLRVLVRDAITALPTLLFWQPGEPLTGKVIRITVTDGFSVKDMEAASGNPGLELHMETVKPGVEYKLTVTPKSAHLKATISIKPQGDQTLPPLTAHIRVT